MGCAINSEGRERWESLDRPSSHNRNGGSIMTAKNNITYERVRELFVYDPGEGLLRNSVARGGRSAGEMAGYLEWDGYVRVYVDGRKYLAHRLIYLLAAGEWPPNQIDHKNLCKFDGRWENLRHASRSQNEANKSIRRDNTSGFKGVSWHAGVKKWQARTRIGGQRRHLGYFDRIEDAAAAYWAAVSELHGEFARCA
jgi:hypothetical protein